jgi:hypothetical protein
MTTAPESTSTHHAARRQTAHTPRPLPAWLQVGVVVLLLVNGVQTALHLYSGQGSRVAQTPPPSSTDQLSRFEYTYTPDRLVSAAQTTPSTPQERVAYDPYRATANLSPAFQYAGYYAHAPGAMNVTPMRAYAPTTGRWVERDPLPAK